MNTNKKILFFAGFLIVVFLIIGFVSAGINNSNQDEKVSFFDWLKNLFMGKESTGITGKVVEKENFVDYTEDYPIEGVENLQGQNIDPPQLNSDTGILTISGTGESSFVKIKTKGEFPDRYDLSDGGTLIIDSKTGNILPGSKFKTASKRYSFSDTQKIREFPEGSTVELLEGGGISITDSAGKIFKLENSGEFDILYSEGTKRIKSFSFKAGENSKLSFKEGEFSFLEGEEVSFTHETDNPAILNIPDDSKILRKPLDMFVNGKGTISADAGILGLNEDLTFEGHFGFDENGIAHTFRGEAGPGEIGGLKLGNGMTINTYATSPSSAYLFFEEPPAKFAEESYIAMGDELKFKNKEGDQNDLFILDKNKYLKDFDPERHFVALRSFGNKGDANLFRGVFSLVEVEGIQYTNGKEITKFTYSETLGRETFLFDTFSPKRDSDLVSMGVVGTTSTGEKILVTFMDKEDTLTGKYNEIYLSSSNPEKYLIPAAERARYGLSNYVIEGEQKPITQTLQEQIFPLGEKPDTRVAFTEFEEGLENLPAFQETTKFSTTTLKEYKDMASSRKQLSNSFGEIIVPKGKGRFTKEEAENVIEILDRTITPQQFDDAFNNIIINEPYKYEFLSQYEVTPEDVKGTSLEPYFKDMQDKSLKYELSLLDGVEKGIITGQSYDEITFYKPEELKILIYLAGKENMPVKDYLEKHPEELPKMGIKTLYKKKEIEARLKEYSKLPFVIQYIRE